MKYMDLQLFAEPDLPSNPITPEINYETEAFINTSPAEGQPTWASLANLTTNMAQSLNEVIQQLTYYADKGWGSSEVTGAQLTLTLTGSVKPGDDACDYILSDDVMYGLGEKRKTHMKLQKGKKIIIWPITLANITPAYGDANNINSLTVTIMEYKLNELTKRVDKHNNTIERTYHLEEQMALQEEKMKVANHRISDLEGKVE